MLYMGGNNLHRGVYKGYGIGVVYYTMPYTVYVQYFQQGMPCAIDLDARLMVEDRASSGVGRPGNQGGIRWRWRIRG